MGNKGKGKTPKELSAKDYGRIMIMEDAADRLYSNRVNIDAILYRENKEAYITNDWKTDCESLFNVYFRKADIDEAAVKLLGDLGHHLLDLMFNYEKKHIWDNAAECVKKFCRKYSPAQYFSIVRKVSINNIYSFYLYPLWMILDYEYFPNGIYVGETEKGPTPIKTIFKDCDETFDVPFCYLNSIDNYNEDKKGKAILTKLTTQYLLAKRESRSKFSGLNTPEKLTEAEDFMCSVANYCASNTIINKFLFDSPVVLPSNELSAYTMFIRIMSKRQEDRDLDEQLTNVLYEIPADIFTRRKYIITDSTFPKLEYHVRSFTNILTDGTKKTITACVENIRVIEKLVKKDEQDYFMIFMTYSVLGLERTIPICIDNMHATVHAFNIIDKQALLLLFGIYGLLDEISNVEMKFNLFFDAFEGIKKFISQYEYKCSEPTGAERTKGYHQKKEVYVDAFVRRLPKGQVASEQAKELAKQYRVELGDDHTIVSPYIRNKGKGNNEKE